MDGKWNWISVNGQQVGEIEKQNGLISQMVIEGDQVEFNYGSDYEGRILMQDGHICFKLKGPRFNDKITPPVQQMLQGFVLTSGYNIRSNRLRLLDDDNHLVMQFQKVIEA